MSQGSLRLTTLLSPALYETYKYIARYLGEQLNLATRLYAGQTVAEFEQGKAEIGFLCGLLYVHLARTPTCPVELLAAPVLLGERYQDAPLYFSDVIVRRESPYTSFTDLRGCTWAYNEVASHSGYNLVSYHLLEHKLPLNYFGRMIETGSHLQSLQAVLDGTTDAAALDSHLLDALLFEQQPELRERLRVVATPGPSSIPPLVILKNLDSTLKQRVRETLLTMHHHPQVARELGKGRIKRFATITNEDYAGMRAMFERVQAATKTSLVSR